jgi:N-acetylmuramic acid 6-phosphate (MurNAc-6-P) etherase
MRDDLLVDLVAVGQWPHVTGAMNDAKARARQRAGESKADALHRHGGTVAREQQRRHAQADEVARR